MKTEAHYRTTIPMSDIIALLIPVLEQQYDAEDIEPHDLALKYNSKTDTFTVELDLELEVDLAGESSTTDFEFEAEIERHERVEFSYLNDATGGDGLKWPKMKQNVLLVDRNGTETKAVVARIDDDGELFVELGDDRFSVSNYDRDDLDGDYYLPEIASIRWSSIS